MNIREIKQADIETLSALYVSVFSQPPWNESWELQWAVDRLSDIYASPGFIGLLYEENKIVSGALVGRSLPFKGRKEFEIVEFFVKSSDQSAGIGSTLLSKLELALTSKAYKTTTLLTAKGGKAERFYNNRGFKSSTKMVFMSHEL